MKLIPAVMIYLLQMGIIFSQQTINCQLLPVNSLDFFLEGPADEIVAWPDSTVTEIENTLNDSLENNVALQFLPLAMLEMNHYFETGITQEAFYKVMRYSKLFAATLNDSSWLIDMNNFCYGTNSMIRRFNAWYDNDTMLANMLFTYDRGPYFGTPHGSIDQDETEITDSINFPGTGLKLYIGLSDEKHIIFVKDAFGNQLNSFEILEDYNDEDVKTLFSEVKCLPIEDFGYSLLVFVSDGICRLYFDKQGRLRFYFII